MVGDPTPASWSARPRPSPRACSYDEYRIGGTSLSSPLFAGVMALADQRPACTTASPTRTSTRWPARARCVTSSPVRSPPSCGRNYANNVDASAGFANPSVRTIDADLQSLRTLNGYDTLTGLGAPNGASFVGAG